ncbi:MAG: TraB/GumN family protein [Cloacibacterium sp.]|uniref:TraB/GumN family protein n=1 Tax=Cloacibacterium sp. TaxID=1913682 RepID=UPI003C75314A
MVHQTLLLLNIFVRADSFVLLNPALTASCKTLAEILNNIMVKRHFILTFLLISSFLLSQKSIFWKISKNGNDSYILGTYHYLGKDFFKDDEIIFNALKNSKVAYSENIDSAKAFINQRNQNLVLKKLNEKEFQTIKKIVPKYVDWNKMTIKELIVTIDGKITSKFCLSEKEKLDSIKLDDYLKEYSIKNKIQLLGLESTSKTFDYLNSNIYKDYDENKLLKILEDKIQTLNSKEQNINCAILQEYRTKKHNFNFSKESQQKMLTIRNKDWINTIDKSIQENKNIFIFVGLYHLDFKDGLLELLKNRGYSVSPIELK